MLPEIPEEIEDGRLQNAALSSFPYSLYFKTVRSVITEYGEELLYRSPNEAVRFCETVLHPICCVIVDYLHSRNRLLSDRERNICMVRLCVFLERIRFMELKIRPIIRSGKSMRERVRSVKCCLWGKMESGVMCWHRQGRMCCT